MFWKVLQYFPKFNSSSKKKLPLLGDFPLLVSEKNKGRAYMMVIQACFSSSNKRDHKVGEFSGRRRIRIKFPNICYWLSVTNLIEIRCTVKAIEYWKRYTGTVSEQSRNSLQRQVLGTARVAVTNKTMQVKLQWVRQTW